MTLPDPEEWPVDSPLAECAGDFLRERAASRPDQLAVVDADTGERWTFGAVDDRVAARAAQFADRFPEGRVGLLLDTGVAFADLFFSAQRRGRTLVPLNVRLDEAALREQAARTDLAVLVCDSDTEGTALAAAPDEVPVASVDEPARDGVEFLDSRGSEPATTAAVEPDFDADRLVAFTSGTTGRPKGVRLTDRNLAASAAASVPRLGVEPDDRWLCCLPMYHVGGLSILARSTLYGTTTVLQRSFDAARAAAVIDEYDVTGVSLVPTMLDRLLEAGWTPPESVRFVLLGGGPAPESLLDRAIARGVPVYPTYGTTETASQIATATPAEVREHPGTVGRPLRNTSVTVVDPSEAGDGARDRECDQGETGEFVVDGPTVTPGYLDAAETRAAFGQRGLHTGDLGYVDERGRLYVVGRVDDAITTGGETVHPERVVDALRAVDGIADAAAIGLPDEEWGERVAALVVPADDETCPTTGEVRDAVRGSLPDFAVPKTVAFADELPRTPSGTVDRATVRRVLAADERD